MGVLGKTKKKLNNISAFTLAELLVTIIIMLMVTSVVATGIPSAKKAYKNIVMTSNAEVLLSTTCSTLRNELGTAKNVKIEDGNKITYYNENINAVSKIYLQNNAIMYKGYSETEENLSKGEMAKKLISDQTATNGLKITYESISPEEGNPANGVITFNGLNVKDYDGKEVARRESFTIRMTPY